MRSPAAIPLFGDAYLADTTHLTTEEHGAYLLLMIAAWRQPNCDLPNDDKKLARIAGLSTRKWGVIKDTILEFWTVENGRIFQPRLRKEYDFVCKKSEANRKSAKARWDKQPTENIEGDECERISEGNAPPPPPNKEGLSKDNPPFEKPKKSKPQKQRSQLPDDWRPKKFNEGTECYRITSTWTPQQKRTEVEAFIAHHKARGSLMLDWDQAFVTWITNTEKFGSKGGRNGTGTTQNRSNAGDRSRAIDIAVDRAKRIRDEEIAQAGNGGALRIVAAPIAGDGFGIDADQGSAFG